MKPANIDVALAGLIARFHGVSGVGDTPDNRGQCVGLVECWLDALGLPHIWGDAKDLLDNAPVAQYQAVPNTPTNYPAVGDVIVWGESWGSGHGHTAICVWADANTLVAFEQNDPWGAAPQTKCYSYSGVTGWLHPRVTP